MAKATTAIKQRPHVFVWEGTDHKGKRLRGESRTSSITMVKAELRRQGITPLKVRKKSAGLFTNHKQRILPKDIAVFARQLATMMSSGVPMVQAIEIVARGHSNPSMQDLLLSIKNDVEGGSTLTDALRKHPLYFNDLFCNLVHAGEQAGVLETLLDKIATYKEKTESLKGKIKKALFYPTTVIVMAIVITAIIMIFVIPQFKSLFAGFEADLPAFTKLVVSLSDFVAAWWWALLSSTIIFFGLSIFTLKRSPRLREILDTLLLKLPVLGNSMHKVALARFCRTTATMFTAGVPLVEALGSVAGATGNRVYEKAVLAMRDDVATGQSLQLTMKQQDLFPHMVTQMVAIGEESGALDEMLTKVADFYEEEVDNAIDALSSLLEPMIMAILGTLIGGLVIAMYLPIFQMGSVF